MNSVIERANGSTFLEISKSNFRQIKIVIPTTDSLNNFTNQFELMFDQIRINTIEIKELTNLRDTLLPKLISGELEINETNN
jgi:type I restriction enzyme S subunit